MIQDMIPHLINMVKDSDADVRHASVTVLGHLAQQGQHFVL
jgi:hypothetical protein